MPADRDQKKKKNHRKKYFVYLKVVGFKILKVWFIMKAVQLKGLMVRFFRSYIKMAGFELEVTATSCKIKPPSIETISDLESNI